MNPDPGRFFLKQAKYVARALTSFEPRVTDSEYAFIRKTLEGRFGVMKKGWYRAITPLGDSGYIYFSKGEEGEFSKTLPEGAKVEGTLSTAEEKAVVSRLFKIAVSYLENNKIFSRSFSICLLMHNEKPDEVDWSFKSEYEKTAIRLLKESLAACHPTYNWHLLISFRRSLTKLPRLLNNPSICYSMQEFVKRLAKDRQKYAVNGKFLGEILAANMICIQYAEAACSTVEEPEKKYWIYYDTLVAPIIDSRVRPDQFFPLVVEKVLEAGGIDIVWAIAEKYREIVYNTKEAALNSRTIEEFSDLLYSAIPYGWAAFMIYVILAKNTKYLDSKQKKLVNKLRKNSDEILVRIRQPLIYQLFDFDLAFWNFSREHIEEIEKKQGLQAAEQAAKKIVERRMYYPRSFIPKLSGQELGDPQIITI